MKGPPVLFSSVFKTHQLKHKVCCFWHQRCSFSMLKACSVWWLVYSLFTDIRPCWTAGRVSHSSDRLSLSWWSGSETCFRPACNRYDRQKPPDIILFQFINTKYWNLMLCILSCLTQLYFITLLVASFYRTSHRLCIHWKKKKCWQSEFL